MNCSASGKWHPLEELLEERLRVIADHALRDRDAAAHLEKLKDVSLRLMAEQQRLTDELPPRLRHYLSQSSYSKALDWIRDLERPEQGAGTAESI
jgi:hypothetical protein